MKEGQGRNGLSTDALRLTLAPEARNAARIKVVGAMVPGHQGIAVRATI